MTPDEGNAPSPPPLAWPPPGLEALRGRAGVLARSLGVASLFVLGSLIEFMIVSPVAPRRGGLPAPLFVCLGLALVAGLLQLRAALAVWRAMTEGGIGAWRGYTWLTIAEVMTDVRGDTGALIGGEREYGTLTPETRSTMRMFRVASALGRVFAAALPLPAFFVAASLGAAGAIGPTVAVALTIGPSLLILVGAAIVDRMETIPLGPPRDEIAKQFERRTTAIKIADTWYASFEEARAGQNFGRGPAGGVLRAWALGAIGAVLVAAAGAMFLPILALALMGASGRVNPYEPAMTSSRLDAVMYLRSFAAPGDPAITPIQAGEAFHSIDQAGQKARPAYVRPPAHTYPPFPGILKTLFPVRGASPGAGPRSPDVLDFAKKGLSAEQRAYLKEIAANPVWDDFHIVARSTRADMAGGRFITPLPATVAPYALPMTHFQVAREMAYANSSRAALFLADGRPDEAERVLRETIGFGFRVADDGNSSNDVLIGALIVGIGRDALARLFKLTNDPREQQILRGVPVQSQRPRLVEAEPIRFNTTVRVWAPRGIRLESLLESSMQQCFTVRGLLFGKTLQTRRALQSDRNRYGRTPGEKEIFDLYADAVDRPLAVQEPRRLMPKMLLLSARVTGSVLGNPRISNCMKLTIAGA